MRYLLLLSYDGTHFSGWQRQGALRTVQGVVEEAARSVFGVPTKVVACGRTDAGVHALGQVAQLDGETGIPPERLANRFNGLLPSDVKALRSAAAPEGFDCTRAAKKKTYVYRAYFSRAEQPLLSRFAARLPVRPDPERMRSAAQLLLGEHDFCAFRASGYTSRTSVRILYGVKIDVCQGESYTLYQITVTGNGFLYNMVRILAGELFAVGCGKEEGITRAFSTGERSALSKTMPPQGLILLNADFGAPLFGAEVE